jgi:hypothetical protein
MPKNIEEKRLLLVTGFIGLLAAVITGSGEFLLHYDPLARYSESNYNYLLAGSTQRETIGHFLGVFGAPLYLVGCWHIFLMLKTANKTLAFIGFLIGAYGFMIGADWLSSRASIGALMHFKAQTGDSISQLIALYELRYESLLNVVRATTLTLSIIFVVLVLSGRSYYSKWHALVNPIVLLILSFVVYALAPSVGKYVMPIALNVGFGLFFLVSLLQANSLNFSQQAS